MKVFILFFLLIISVYSKSDFFYGFVDSTLNQISDEEKRKITQANNEVESIRRVMQDGDLNYAANLIDIFNKTNDVKIVQSQAILLQSEILYKQGTKTKINQADEILQKAINQSIINQDDLLEAYRLAVLIKISLNKSTEAEYFASAIEHTFDDPSQRVYGRLAMAQIHIKKREYRKAIRILQRELIEANDLEVATIIADDLFDAYMLHKEDDKAKELVVKVLEKNIDYYANDSYKATVKVKKLLKAKMPKLAIKILLRLLENAKVKENIDNFRFELANIYMSLAGFEKEYLPKAKVIYESLIQKKENNPLLKDSKMYLDEIIMREGRFDPQMIATKYSGSDDMQFKALMQELINSIADKKYEQVLRMKKIYTGIPQEIINRFGYESLENVYKAVNADMLSFYLNTDECKQLTHVINDVDEESLLKLSEDKKPIDKLFGCVLEYPNVKNYEILKNVYSTSKNPDIVLYLERVAILLKKYDDANSFSAKLDMINNGEALSKEFLYRFLIYGFKNSSYGMEKFFNYAKKNQEFITNNQDNPMIIDFYYQYYLYLLKHNDENKAIEILHKLYEKQKSMQARVYSPFVELELAKYAKLDDNYEKSLEYLEDGLSLSRTLDGKAIERKIKKDDLSQIYYEMAKIYEHFGKENKYKTMIKKCQNLKDVDSYYKKMCDKM